MDSQPDSNKEPENKLSAFLEEFDASIGDTDNADLDYNNEEQEQGTSVGAENAKNNVVEHGDRSAKAGAEMCDDMRQQPNSVIMASAVADEMVDVLGTDDSVINATGDGDNVGYSPAQTYTQLLSNNQSHHHQSAGPSTSLNRRPADQLFLPVESQDVRFLIQQYYNNNINTNTPIEICEENRSPNKFLHRSNQLSTHYNVLQQRTGATSTVLLPVLPVTLADGSIVMQLQMPPMATVDHSQAKLAASANKPSFTPMKQPKKEPEVTLKEKTLTLVPTTMNVIDNPVTLTTVKKNKLEPEFEEAIVTVETTDEEGATVIMFECNLCQYIASKRYMVQRHMRSHSERRPYVCTFVECDRAFKTPSALKNHIDVHTGTKKHLCKQCDSAFTTSGELSRHCRYRHSNERPHECPICDMKCVELAKLKKHMQQHTGEKPYKCSHCAYDAIDIARLKRHERVHTGEKPYTCSDCGLCFAQSSVLSAHRKIHTVELKDRQRYECEFCGKRVTRATDLRKHQVNMHTPSSVPIICKLCGKTCSDKHSLIVHRKEHKNNNVKIKCKLCDYKATAKRFLKQHMMIHFEDKPFVCKRDNCYASFSQYPQLRRHERYKHDPNYEKKKKPKEHTCNTCNTKFHHLRNLKKHLAAHATGRIDRYGMHATTVYAMKRPRMQPQIKTRRLRNLDNSYAARKIEAAKIIVRRRNKRPVKLEPDEYEFNVDVDGVSDDPLSVQSSPSKDDIRKELNNSFGFKRVIRKS